MSIRFLFTLCVLVVIGCDQPQPIDDRFDISEEKRDSISERYNDIANYFWQPTEGYRRYKDSAILVSPEHVGYRQTLSYAYKKRGEHIDAMKTLNEAVDLDIAQGSFAALEYRAWTMLYYYRDYETAISDIDKITEMSGTTFNVCWGEDCSFQKGQALYRLGKYDDAIQAFDLSLADLQSNGLDVADEIYTYFYYGRCLDELGDRHGAMAMYERALFSHPNFSEAIFQKARIYRMIGDHQKAEESLIKAEKLLNGLNKMGEPYFERFDELFPWMIEEERKLQSNVILN